MDPELELDWVSRSGWHSEHPSGEQLGWCSAQLLVIQLVYRSDTQSHLRPAVPVWANNSELMLVPRSEKRSDWWTGHWSDLYSERQSGVLSDSSTENPSGPNSDPELVQATESRLD